MGKLKAYKSLRAGLASNRVHSAKVMTAPITNRVKYMLHMPSRAERSNRGIPLLPESRMSRMSRRRQQLFSRRKQLRESGI